MKTKFMVKDQSGFTLLEVMIAAAMMGGLALLMAQMTTNLNTSAESVEKKFGINTEMAEMKDTLSKKVGCGNSFLNADMDALPVAIPNIQRDDGTIKWVVGNNYDANNLRLNSLNIVSWTADGTNPNAGEAVVRVQWEKLGRYLGPQFVTKDITLRTTVDGGNRLVDCYTSFGGTSTDNVWSLNADGIYYDDGTAPQVAIGAVPDTADGALLQVDGSASIGANAFAKQSTSYALGGTADRAHALAIGEFSQALQKGSIAIGGSSDVPTAALSNTDGSVAIGSANTWNPDATVANNYGAKALGEGSLAIGQAIYDATNAWYPGNKQRPGAAAEANASIAIGPGSLVSEQESLAIGLLSKVYNDSAEVGLRPRSMAIGHLARAYDSYSMAIGYDAHSGELGSLDSDADNARSIAIGVSATAYDEGNVAIGDRAETGQTGEDIAKPVEGHFAIAIGATSKSYDYGNISIGRSAESGDSAAGDTSPNAIAIGSNAKASAISGTTGGNIAIGRQAHANQPDTIALGTNAFAFTDGSIVIGRNAISNDTLGGESIVIGQDAKSLDLAEKSVVIGKDALAEDNGDGSVVIGHSADAHDHYGIAIGYGATSVDGVLFDGGIAIGKDSSAMGRGFAIGFETYAENAGIAFGYRARAEGSYNAAFMGQITGSGNDSIAIGENAVITSNVNNSVVIAPGQGVPINVTTSNTFRGYFPGGYDFCTAGGSACTDGARIAADGTYSNISDKNRKQQFELIDAEDFLDKFLGLDLFWWNYTNSPEEKYRHLGPMAQDFKRAFGTFGPDTSINMTDITGVAMVGIKGLALKNQKLSARIDQLEAENLELKNRLDRIEDLLEKK